MQLLTSEKDTSTNTDRSSRILLDNVISHLFVSQIKKRRLTVDLKYKTTYEDLNLDVLQQILRIESQFKPQGFPEFPRTSQFEERTIKVVSNITLKNEVTNTFQKQAIEIVYDRLIELWQEKDEDEYGILKPTSYAFDTAWRLVSDASNFLKENFPKASVSTDDQGGIRLTWTHLKSETEVRLICPSEPNQTAYLYRENSEKHGIIDGVTALTLASWLQWFNNA